MYANQHTHILHLPFRSFGNFDHPILSVVTVSEETKSPLCLLPGVHARGSKRSLRQAGILKNPVVNSLTLEKKPPMKQVQICNYDS